MRKSFGGYGRDARPHGGTMRDMFSVHSLDPVFVLTALMLTCALLFGGASRLDVLQLAGLELMSLPVMGVAFWRLHKQGALPGLLVPLILLALIAAIPVLQLTPLPFDAWRSLPGRAGLADGLRLAGMRPSHLALSLAPDRTEENALALLIPAGVFIGALACNRDQRRALIGIVVLAAIASLLLGIGQLAGGPDSALRFYESPTPQFANGLFANRNHQALFLLLSLPMLAAVLKAGKLAPDGKTIAAVLTVLGFVLVMLVGVAETRSRAGLLLTFPAIAGAWAVFQRTGHGRRFNLIVLIIGGVLLLALAGGLVVFHTEVLHRFSSPLEEDARRQIWASTAQAARQFAPLGSGIGSFDRVYPSVETIQAMQFSFVNHAHNDYLEIWLEAGWLGIAALLAFAAWFVSRAFTAWRLEGSGPKLAQAGSVVVMLIALHSAIDYPARTPAMLAMLALACAFLAAPLQKTAKSSALRETYPS